MAVRTDIRRRGALRQAIEARNAPEILRLVRERVVVDEAGCWLWARVSPQGYPAVSRDPSIPVHRLVVWSSVMQCRSELSELPNVHHLCGRTACVRPTHLVPVSAAFNVLESQTRNAVIARLRVLTDALRDVAPEHPALTSWPEIRLLPLGQLLREREERRGRPSPALARRREREAVHAAHRFRQVSEANKLLASGLTRREVAARLGIGLATLDAWRRRAAETAQTEADRDFAA